MSRNVKKTMDDIFKVLESYVADEDKCRIELRNCNIKANVDDEMPVVDFVKKCKIFIRHNSIYFFNAFKYDDSIYLMAPKKTEQVFLNLGLDIVDDEVIIQGTAMIAIAKKALPMSKEINSLDIINRCLGQNIEEIYFSDILELFEPYTIVCVKNDRFSIQYEEDIERIYDLMYLNYSEIDDNTKNNIENLLLLNSSRGIAVSINNALKSEHWEYLYLQLYQCLEYLFIIRTAISLKSKYNIDDKIAIDIASSGQLRTTENDNLISVLQLTPESSIENFYSFIPGDSFVSKSDENKKQTVSNYIYRIRCNIAHLRFNQEILEIEELKTEIIRYLSEIILNTYQNNDLDIVNICHSKSPWKEIKWIW